MEKVKKVLSYQGCQDCLVQMPEKECVSCCVPRRENIVLLAGLMAKDRIREPIILGWGTAD